MTREDARLWIGEYHPPGSGVAYWNGAAWSQPSPGFFGTAFSLLAKAGELFAGGDCVMNTAVGEVTNIAKWNGTNWLPLNGGLGKRCDGDPAYIPCPIVNALVSFQGTVHAGGIFNRA